uniref:(northern house mosquito) hypothetical protein n=1 Tax=Culex pipiens TaxID=7175 RepID=A0A8D8BNN6_CULPI
MSRSRGVLLNRGHRAAVGHSGGEHRHVDVLPRTARRTLHPGAESRLHHVQGQFLRWFEGAANGRQGLSPVSDGHCVGSEAGHLSRLVHVHRVSGHRRGRRHWVGQRSRQVPAEEPGVDR